VKEKIKKIGKGIVWAVFILSVMLFIEKIGISLEKGGFSVAEGNIFDYLFPIIVISGILLFIIYKPSYWPIRMVTKREAEILDKIDEWDYFLEFQNKKG